MMHTVVAGGPIDARAGDTVALSLPEHLCPGDAIARWSATGVLRGALRVDPEDPRHVTLVLERPGHGVLLYELAGEPPRAGQIPVRVRRGSASASPTPHTVVAPGIGQRAVVHPLPACGAARFRVHVEIPGAEPVQLVVHEGRTHRIGGFDAGCGEIPNVETPPGVLPPPGVELFVTANDLVVRSTGATRVRADASPWCRRLALTDGADVEVEGGLALQIDRILADRESDASVGSAAPQHPRPGSCTMTA